MQSWISGTKARGQYLSATIAAPSVTEGTAINAAPGVPTKLIIEAGVGVAPLP